MIALAPLARAEGVSLDVELLQLVAAPDALPGIVPARTFDRGVAGAALQVQVESEPVVLYVGQQSLGPIVGTRLDLQLAGSYGFTRWLTAQLALPVSFDWGSEHPRMTTEGLGGGMGRAGLRAAVVQGPVGALAVSAALALPVISGQTWRGDNGATFTPALAGALDLGRVGALGSFGVILREEVQTDYRLVVGTELAYDWAVRVEIAEERAWVWGGSLVRVVPDQLDRGTGVWELLIGLSGRVDPLRIDTFVGRGLSIGPGATQVRGGVALTWSGVVSRPRVREVVRFPPPDDVPDEVQRVGLTGPSGEPAWKEGELARIDADDIVIREPIQFEFATNQILPVSRPTLAAVAQILHDHGEILHVVVEGHASVEGTDAYNYALADSRAAAVWEALVASGVHPDRVSLRSLGETRPVDFGNTEVALAANRRVEFHIVRRLRPGEAPPVYTPVARPWDGR